MKIKFNFEEDVVPGLTIVAAVDHVSNFLDAALVEKALIHPISRIEVSARMGGMFTVSMTDDAGQEDTETFYFDDRAEQWMPLNQHPFVVVGALVVSDDC